jgi:DNA-binding transcriptional MerR regulator
MPSVPDDDALRRQFYATRDVRSLYPRVSENHLRYLEKWGLIRPAAHTSAERFYTFTDLSTIKQLAGELERHVPLKTALRTLLAEHQGQLQLDFHASGTSPAKVVLLQGRPSRRAPDKPPNPIASRNYRPPPSPPATPFRSRIRRRRWRRSTSSRARASTTATRTSWKARRPRIARRW